MHSIFNWDTHLYPPHNNSPVHLTTITKVLRSERITDWLENTTRLCSFIPDVGTHPPWTALPRIAWDRLNRLRTGVERFRSYLHKWGMSPSAACECGTDVQTVEHVVIHCPIHRPPYGVHQCWESQIFFLLRKAQIRNENWIRLLRICKCKAFAPQ